MTEIRVCVVCDYQRGFHFAVKSDENGHHLVLICPSCGQSYLPGWQLTLAADHLEKGAVYE